MARLDAWSSPTITFHRLAEIAAADWLCLLTDPETRRHMPLAGEHWDEARAEAWARGKDDQWQANGYGPWAIRIDGAFAGWGGFQKDGREADLGLVLLPQFWGHGAAIFRRLLASASTLHLDAVTLLLPPSRSRQNGLRRLGFEPAGECVHGGHVFLKYRLAR